MSPPFETFSATLIASGLSVLTGVAVFFGVKRALKDCELTPGRWPLWFALAGVLIGAAFVWCSLVWKVQSTPEVIPSEFWRQWRIVYHLSLISLLLIVTATDLKGYFIVDWCCWTGVAIAIAGAVISGEFQLAHVWVDWNAEVPQLRGPDIPDWLAPHPHLHGLAWSVAGLCCGVAVTWTIRWVSSKLLSMNTLGSGDVLLMAMIGAYLGWQPTVFVLLLAPILALMIGGSVRLVSNKAILPFGPFLALGALIVLFCWKRIWMAEFSLSRTAVASRDSTFAIRRFFGDPIGILIALGISSGLLILLLGLLRLYKTIPIKRGRED